MSIDKDPLVVPDGPITRSRTKKIKEAMAGLVHSNWAELAYSSSKVSTFKMGFKEEEPALIHVIQAKEELAISRGWIINFKILFRLLLSVLD